LDIVNERSFMKKILLSSFLSPFLFSFESMAMNPDERPEEYLVKHLSLLSLASSPDQQLVLHLTDDFEPANPWQPQWEDLCETQKENVDPDPSAHPLLRTKGSSFYIKKRSTTDNVKDAPLSPQSLKNAHLKKVAQEVDHYLKEREKSFSNQPPYDTN
jgi:hypothetical protein